MACVDYRKALAAVAVAWCAVAVGCAGARVNAWPLLFRETRLQDGEPVTTVEALYPLLAFERGAGRSYHALRPLYNYERLSADGSSRVQFLWPLGLVGSRANDRTLWRLWPLFQHITTTRRNTGEKTTHGMIIPLVFWGRTPEEGPYFALVPFGGVTHRLMGNTCAFVAFPLYNYYRLGEYKRHNVLWPLLSWGGTPDGKRRLLRLWPLYVRDRLENPDGRSYEHNYVLWFLLRWGQQAWGPPGRQHERRYVSVFPFYADQAVRDSSGELLAHRRRYFLFDQSYDNREKKEGKGWSLLFGLIKFSRSEEADEYRILPFYWRHTRYPPGGRESGRKWTRSRIPWPIVWRDVDTVQPGRRVANLVVAPFYWHYTSTRQGDEGAVDKERKVTLWPLFTVQAQTDGEWDLWLLSHGWHDASEGFKRNYRAFFDLFQFHRRASGEKETRLLWRLYHHKRGPEGRYLSVPALVSYDSIGDDGADGQKSWSVLFGLLKRTWQEDGPRRWRLFYIPLGRGATEKTTPAAEGAEETGTGRRSG
ncbi:MAG: hypothetical protein QGH74_03035 [Candidatus Brocadiia bacterium]|nr:hypothetical protein [Candidatus Brocadiia bacterium]